MNYQTVLQNYHPTEQGDFMLRYEIGGRGYVVTHRRRMRCLVLNYMAFPSLLLGNWLLFFPWICSR